MATINGTNGNDVLMGTFEPDVIHGLDGDDVISGMAGADKIYGGAGNDLIYALLDGDIIDGGDGVDIVSYVGPIAGYLPTTLARGYNVTIDNMGFTVSARGIVDKIIAVEEFHFRDAVLTFDVDSNAAFVMRLYDSILNREPDAVGLDAWLDRMDGGTSKKDIARGFVDSPDFVSATGMLSTSEFVEFLYNSALGRPSDAAGKAEWVSRIDGGLSRSEVAIGFSESPEHRIQTNNTLARGLWVTDDTFQQVVALYDSFADRLPDKQELMDWVSRLNNGTTLRYAALHFANSTEFMEKTSGFSNSDLVEFMYINTLNRSSDPGGKQAWLSALEGGMSKGDLLLGFSSSEEHFSLIHDHIYAGVEFLS